MSSTINIYSSKMHHKHLCSSNIYPEHQIYKNTDREHFYCTMSTFTILTYFYLSKVLNAGLLLVVEYFHSVVLVLLLQDLITSSTTGNN